LTDRGTEVHPEAVQFVERVAHAAPVLRRSLNLPGFVVEEKGPCLAVHYRRAADTEAARRLVISLLGPLADLHGMTLFEGRMVVELRPALPFGKGWSLQDMAQSQALRSLVYLGDDRTDIEAFDALRSWRRRSPDRHGVGIGVASLEMPEALAAASDCLVDGPYAVENLLSKLVEERLRDRSGNASIA
jgi:trehalose-phosphatase